MEGTDGCVHLVGLEEDLFRLHPCGDLLHGFGQLGIHQLAHIRHDGICFHCHADGQCGFAAHKEAVALRRCISPLHTGHIAQPHLFAVREADQKVADVSFILHGIANPQLQAVIAILIVPGIHCLARALQRHHDLRRNDAVARNLLFGQGDVDDLITVAHNVDALHPLHAQQLAAKVFGIFTHILRGQFNAFGNGIPSIGVITAQACFDIQQRTTDIGKTNPPNADFN